MTVKAAGGRTADAAAATATTTTGSRQPGSVGRVLDQSVDVGGVTGDAKNIVGGVDGRNAFGTFLEAVRDARGT